MTNSKGNRSYRDPAEPRLASAVVVLACLFCNGSSQKDIAETHTGQSAKKTAPGLKDNRNRTTALPHLQRCKDLSSLLDKPVDEFLIIS